ncbi:MAG: YraN family protein [Clostridia bacterium]|nr:YraN family protein [Clostridia bacterium]
MSIFDIFGKRKENKDNRTLKRAVGDLGEEAACKYLVSHGYKIIDRNVRISHKELDIIAEDDYHIVVVEVKTLSQTREQAQQHGQRASEHIDREKALNLLSAAKYYTAANYNGKTPRIDVIEVYLGGGTPELVHTENAVNHRTLYRHRR